jgi:RNA polymerase sigma-70 factor, ECF subfamily
MDYDDREALCMLRAVAAGRREAFARLYAMTSERTAAWLRRVLHDRDSAEEILICTYVEVWRNAERFDGRSAVMTWIIGVARNVANNSLKVRRQRASRQAWHEALVSEDVGTDEESHRSIVNAALRALPQQHREILALALLREFSYSQIASVLTIPVATVKTRVFYAKAAMRTQLADMGIAREDVL